MPTGYTADVKDGKITEFPEFALACARAFGALILMRDDPADAPIPDKFEPDTSYHDDREGAAKKLVAELPTLSYADCVLRATAEHSAACEAYNRRETNRKQARQRYEAMLAKVTAWTPPTSDHVGLRDFMIEQLNTSIDFDCSGKYDTPPEMKSGDQWREDALRKAERDLSYHAIERQKEIDRAANRTEWVRQLRGSLAP